MSKALIFDCDGTLILSGPLHFRALHTVLGDLDWEWYRGQLGLTFPAMLEGWMALSGRRLDPDQVEAEARHRYFEGLDELQINAPVVEVARRYRGHLPMAVASNGSREMVEASLRATGLLEYFDTVVTVDQVDRGKPEPDMFLEAARRMGVGECHVFEDSAEGLEAARRAGMTATDVRERFQFG